MPETRSAPLDSFPVRTRPRAAFRFRSLPTPSFRFPYALLKFRHIADPVGKLHNGASFDRQSYGSDLMDRLLIQFRRILQRWAGQA